jgi:Ca2+-binding EF-hand superfamily protein
MGSFEQDWRLGLVRTFKQETPSMRALRITLMGFVALFLAVTQGVSQFDGGNSRSRSMDPNQFFNGLANGKEVWVRSETNPALQPMFDKIAEKLGATDGKITRDQFLSNMNQKMKRIGGDANGAMPPGASPGQPRTDAELWDARAEEIFRRHDLNGDGVLSYEEMPEDLRNERDRWDTDQNGTIDLNEFKAFYRAKMQQLLNDRNQAALGGAWQNPGMPTPDTRAVTPAEGPRVKVYHYENLPKELPPWFKQMDTNHDAQVALYEWKASGRPIAEFLRMDRNNDGFLTVEEVLWYESQVAKTKPPDKGPISPGTRPSPVILPGRTVISQQPLPQADAPGPNPVILPGQTVILPGRPGSGSPVDIGTVIRREK